MSFGKHLTLWIFFISVKDEKDDEDDKKEEKVKKEPLSLEELMAKRQAEEMARSKVFFFFCFNFFLFNLT